MSNNDLLISGPLIIGYCLVCGLFGVLSYQIMIYHNSFHTTDKPFLKGLVYLLYIIVIAQTTLNLYNAIWTFGSQYGPVVTLTQKTYITVPLLTGAIALIVQGFYAKRIFILTGSRSYVLPTIIVILSIIQFIGAIVTGIYVALQHNLLELSTTKFFNIIQATWSIPSGLCDIVIAVCMWKQVYKRRKDNVMRRTQAILLQVVKLVIGTGLMTATVACLSGSFFVAFPHRMIYGVFALSLGPLYANSMLVVLNNRLRHAEIIARYYDNVTSHIPQDHHSIHFRQATMVPPPQDVVTNVDAYRMSDVTSTPTKVEEDVVFEV